MKDLLNRRFLSEKFGYHFYYKSFNYYLITWEFLKREIKIIDHLTTQQAKIWNFEIINIKECIWTIFIFHRFMESIIRSLNPVNMRFSNQYYESLIDILDDNRLYPRRDIYSLFRVSYNNTLWKSWLIKTSEVTSSDIISMYTTFNLLSGSDTLDSAIKIYDKHFVSK